MSAKDEPLEVLVAEDNEVNQIVLTGLLGHARPQWRFTVVRDGAQAVSAWREGAFGLILMDVRMPGVDGLQAAAAIRAEEAAAGRPRTPIVAMTGAAMPDEIAACRAAGMDGHATKPIDLPVLLAAIEAALG
ncbi:MAG: response regulator [Rubrimonas sp.]